MNLSIKDMYKLGLHAGLKTAFGAFNQCCQIGLMFSSPVSAQKRPMEYDKFWMIIKYIKISQIGQIIKVSKFTSWVYTDVFYVVEQNMYSLKLLLTTYLIRGILSKSHSKKQQVLSAGGRAVSYQAPLLWNHLPIQISAKTCPHIVTLARQLTLASNHLMTMNLLALAKLKTHLFAVRLNSFQ